MKRRNSKQCIGAAKIAQATGQSALSVPDPYYVGPGGSWNRPADWNTAPDSSGAAGTPKDGEAASIVRATSLAVIFDMQYAAGLASLILDGTGGAEVTLEHSATSARMCAKYMTVGDYGRAVYHQTDPNIQGQVTRNIVGVGRGNDALILGDRKDASTGIFGHGTYQMDGGELHCVGLKYEGALIVGNSGFGALIYNDGIIAANNVTVGYSGRGIIKHTGAALSIGYLFDTSLGLFNVGAAGPSGYTLFLGYLAGSIGHYNMQPKGTASPALNVYGNIQIGYHGHGTFTQAGGTVTVRSTPGTGNNGLIIMANAPEATSNYTISGGTVTANTIYVGGDASSAGGPATLNVIGGTVKAGLRVHRNGTVNIFKGGTVNVGCGPGDNIFNEGVINIFDGGILKLGGKVYGPGTLLGTTTPCP